MSSSSSHSPCAACKFLRRKCTQECVFAPYFPAEQPQKFGSVHRVYGASNVAKLLNELPVCHRAEAVVSLAYEAEARLRDPIYGCVGFISYLHNRLKQVQAETLAAKKELAAYVGPQAMMMMFQTYHPYPAPTPALMPAPTVHLPPSLNMQVPVGPGSAAGPGAGLAFHEDSHMLLKQEQQMLNGGGFEQSAASVGFGAGVENTAYNSNQVVQVQPEQVQVHQRAVSDAVVDYQIQAHFSLLSHASVHDHQGHCKSDVGP